MRFGRGRRGFSGRKLQSYNFGGENKERGGERKEEGRGGLSSLPSKPN